MAELVLPVHILENIFELLDLDSLQNVRLTCKLWREEADRRHFLLKRAKLLLKSGNFLDKNAVLKRLCCLCSEDLKTLTYFLLKCDPPKKFKNYTIKILASYEGNLKILSILKRYQIHSQYRNINLQTHYHAAAYGGQKYLLELTIGKMRESHYTDIRRHHLMHYAAESGNSETFQYLYQYFNNLDAEFKLSDLRTLQGRTPMDFAFKKSNFDLISDHVEKNNYENNSVTEQQIKKTIKYGFKNGQFRQSLKVCKQIWPYMNAQAEKFVKVSLYHFMWLLVNIFLMVLVKCNSYSREKIFMECAENQTFLLATNIDQLLESVSSNITQQHLENLIESLSIKTFENFHHDADLSFLKQNVNPTKRKEKNFSNTVNSNKTENNRLGHFLINYGSNVNRTMINEKTKNESMSFLNNEIPSMRPHENLVTKLRRIFDKDQTPNFQDTKYFQILYQMFYHDRAWCRSLTSIFHLNSDMDIALLLTLTMTGLLILCSFALLIS